MGHKPIKKNPTALMSTFFEQKCLLSQPDRDIAQRQAEDFAVSLSRMIRVAWGKSAATDSSFAFMTTITQVNS